MDFWAENFQKRHYCAVEEDHIYAAKVIPAVSGLRLDFGLMIGFVFKRTKTLGQVTESQNSEILKREDEIKGLLEASRGDLEGPNAWRLGIF